ncbi:MAG: hypothetical protein JOZ15_20975 [Acidobacteria bacterium]|nr:hypothetical protein [Acidobacteriota bacterium]
MTRIDAVTVQDAAGAASTAPLAAPARAWTATAAAALAVLLAATAAAAAPAPARWAMKKEETLKKTFVLAPSPGGGPGAAGQPGNRLVEIDNFSGAVRVRSHPGGEVTLTVHETWAADSAERLEQARREVRLDIAESAGNLRLFVDGPFRSRDGGTHFNGWESLGYDANFDFDLEVPADVDLIARTVNGGEVRADGIGGRFDASNVNGPVILERMGGPGRARSVNGPVTVSFARNPTAGCTFETVNGKIDVALLSGLAADLRFKTLNGEVYTDYDYTYENPPPSRAEHSRGRFHYRSHGEFGARIAGGGPELAFKTINGDILVRRQGA